MGDLQCYNKQISIKRICSHINRFLYILDKYKTKIIKKNYDEIYIKETLNMLNSIPCPTILGLIHLSL